MGDAHDRRTSKLLALVLRHHPERIGISLDAEGWADVDGLLAGLRAHGRAVSREELDRVVASNDKQRFAYDDSGSRIRASQGHSVRVDLRLERRPPPALLFHGTHEAALTSIRGTGLRRGDRHAVHLSSDPDAAARVGRRRGRPVVLEVDAGQMHVDGHSFTRSANGVWLVDAVPPAYLRGLGT